MTRDGCGTKRPRDRSRSHPSTPMRIGLRPTEHECEIIEDLSADRLRPSGSSGSDHVSGPCPQADGHAFDVVTRGGRMLMAGTFEHDATAKPQAIGSADSVGEDAGSDSRRSGSSRKGRPGSSRRMWTDRAPHGSRHRSAQPSTSSPASGDVRSALPGPSGIPREIVTSGGRATRVTWAPSRLRPCGDGGIPGPPSGRGRGAAPRAFMRTESPAGGPGGWPGASPPSDASCRSVSSQSGVGRSARTSKAMRSVHSRPSGRIAVTCATWAPTGRSAGSSSRQRCGLCLAIIHPSADCGAAGPNRSPCQISKPCARGPLSVPS